MRRADRLFQILQALRSGRVVTARALAAELEVSPRTIYRDVATLLASGVPIEGEAGVGYCLDRDFDLPPLMFDEDELGALLVGVRMVCAFSDGKLAKSARRLLSKVESVVPERLRPRLQHYGVFVPIELPDAVRASMERFRGGIEAGRKVRFSYTDAKGAESTRTVRPLCLAFWGSTWTATGWCELRAAFRHFRPDRMREVELLDEPFAPEPGKDLDSFLAMVRARFEGDGPPPGIAFPDP